MADRTVIQAAPAAGAGLVHLFARGRGVYAEVAVASDKPFYQAFTYRVPLALALVPGAAVLVPFGRETLPGVVLGLSEHSNYDGAVRDVLLAGETLLLPHQIELARWLADTYFAPVAACVALMLPPEAARHLRELIEWSGAAVPDDLTPADAALVARLQASGSATPEALARSFGGPTLAAIERLTGLGLARRTLGLPLPAKAGSAAPSNTRSLPLTLNAEQAAAVAAITAALAQPRGATFLLHGVTGSGKTEVYLAAVAAARTRGRRAIVLVPEIALTSQTVERFAGRFPGEVAISHSGLTPATRYRQWHDVRAGRRAVVVGARSALFLPQPDLGLLVLDEEHEWSYKEVERSPRYHARDAALRLAALTGAVVVLGSATPEVVSAFRAARGDYTLLRLTRRATLPAPAATASVERRVAEPATVAYADGAGALGDNTPADDATGLPPALVVDMAAELRAGNRTMFSRALDGALKDVLRRGEQAILFINRRGSANFILCRDCGHVPRCSGCLVPYTFHAETRQLRCHHCNRARRVPERCSECGSARIRYFGFGTEKVEEEVKRLYPAARVLRWDRDTVRNATDHADRLAAFANREADILVGTQMIAKGLDLPDVTLVGVVSADVALNLPDFRSGERAFQLLTQVAGRAGRRERPGTVVIQTYSPNHHAIRAAARHDYDAMYEAELAVRQRAGYPPYGRLIRLLYTHTNEQHVEAEAKRLLAELLAERRRRGIPGVQALGPAPAFQSKLKGRWRWQIVLRGADPAELLRPLAPLPRGWTVDVDPVSLV